MFKKKKEKKGISKRKLFKTTVQSKIYEKSKIMFPVIKCLKNNIKERKKERKEERTERKY